MASNSDTARQCVDLTLATAPAMVGRAIDQAIASLQEEERRSPSVAQRQELADAWLELTRRRADWSGRYPMLLRQAQAARPAQAVGTLRDEDDFNQLQLVDEDTLAREIESARMLQLIAPKLEQPLAELDALMSSALGLEMVEPERNPLRPVVFAQALHQLMQPATHAGAPRLWARHLAGPIAGEIATLYGEALQVLRSAKLSAASYRVLPTADAAASAARPMPSPGASASQPPQSMSHSNSPQGFSTTGPLGGASWADLSAYRIGDELFQNFLFSRAQPSTQPLAPAYYARVEAQAAQQPNEHFEPYDREAVQQQRTLPPVERPPRAAGTMHELDSGWGRWAPARERSVHRTRLKKEARQVGQVLGLEVVRQLVDQVARDPRLLTPVREAVVALEPALLRLALVAPRFFGQGDHAGRRLVERVAERSFRYNDEFATDFHEFFADVRTTFRALNEQPVHDEQPFAQALQELEERWAGEDAMERRGQQVAVDALHFAEARQAEAAQIAWSLSQRADLEGVPAVVQDFLFGPWSLVMAHSRLTGGKGQVDPGGWNAVIPDLLWSVKSEQTLRDPSRLFTTVPGMLEKLRAGIALLGQDAAQHGTFFGALEKLHRPVMKLRARQRRAAHVPESGPALDPSLLSTQRQKPRTAAGDPWLTPSELQAAGFDCELPSAAAPLEGSAAADEAAQVVAGLRQGCWVDLHARGQWRRASLTWVNQRATLFMFVSTGGQPHTMTRRSLEKLVREQHLRPVEAGAVVPRAIEELSKPAVQREQRVAAFA